ncbi:hypothetical protein C8F01DRAFT_1362531 [Mycena amicta]|nr:hypothetical protein C8F01DRAFT_1362531 [Mycena amicta]
MAPPPKRPSAFDVSFPEEAAERAREAQLERERERKRKFHSEQESPHIQSPQNVEKHFTFTLPEKAKDWVEEARFRPPGEDPDSENKHNGKPVRALSNFCIFDATVANLFMKKEHRLVLPDAKKANDTPTRFAVGVGHLQEQSDEDFGQDDSADSELEHIILHDVLLCPMDYSVNNAPIYIETQLGFYELRVPSAHYQQTWESFLAPRRTARKAVAHASSNPGSASLNCSPEELEAAVPHILEALEDVALAHLKQTPLLQHLLRHHLNDSRSYRPQARRATRPLTRATIGDPDVALLRPENQLQTHVTPRIEKLARGYFDERLHIIGRRLQEDSNEPARRDAATRTLERCLKKVQMSDFRVSYPPSQERQKGPYSHLLKEAEVGDTHYEVGDFVLVCRGEWRDVPAPSPELKPSGYNELPRNFWFARILSFNSVNHKVHLQWLEHGSEILLGDMAHPQELFFTMLCENYPTKFLVDKIVVKHVLRTNRDLYFVRYLYDGRDSSFTEVDQQKMGLFFQNNMPHNCLACHIDGEREQKEQWELVGDDPERRKQPNGVSYRGHKYHTHEFLLFKNEAADGPAHIGYVTTILTSRQKHIPKLEVRIVLRISELKEITNDFDPDPERHLVLTDEILTIPVTQAIRPIHVFALLFFVDEAELKKWLNFSPLNFYCTYRLPSETVSSRAALWPNRRQEVKAETFYVCQFCPSEMYAAGGQELEDNFDQHEAQEDYDCLDLFGGTGAFSLGTAEGTRGCLRPTHLIEITPSAAQTAMRNNKNLVVYNQDANRCLEYFIKSSAWHKVEVPLQNFDNATPVPLPIRGGEKSKMRAIFAGLPWYAVSVPSILLSVGYSQSHSSLNMFRKAEDKKSNLMLTALSYVDFFPTDVFLSSRHKVEGGYEMGGLVLMYRALLEMGYQVRCEQIQAGCHGAPQSRIRFFLVAARIGHTLPKLPQPTHDFPVISKLGFKIPYSHKPPEDNVNKFKEMIFPINTERGKAAHAAVTIEDAIGDLPRFDWEHPNPRKASAQVRGLIGQRERSGVPTLKCDRKEAYCGFEDVEYQHEPQTSFQKQAREQRTENLQHYTRCLLPRTIERVISVPLKAGSDYRDLPNELRDEFQNANPISEVGRNLFRGGKLIRALGWLGILPDYGHEHSSDCEAEQGPASHLLENGNCSRIGKVARVSGYAYFATFETRTLKCVADWFVFEAKNDNVVTMHRQIGNAVHIPSFIRYHFKVNGFKVPFQVSRALGAELRAARLKDFKKRRWSS